MDKIKLVTYLNFFTNLPGSLFEFSNRRTQKTLMLLIFNDSAFIPSCQTEAKTCLMNKTLGEIVYALIMVLWRLNKQI